MARQSDNEPPYPNSALEVKAYCDALIAALAKYLPDRLVCVLLCGSWARVEANPPNSDIDIAVILDTVDAPSLASLRDALSECKSGLINVYGATEVRAMSREALEFYSTNARVLWGSNPFPQPSRHDFALDVARSAESLLRYARATLLYSWASDTQIRDDIAQIFGKDGLMWALRCLVAFRTGRFPKTMEEVKSALANTPEQTLLFWQETLTPSDRVERSQEIALYVNERGRAWLREVEPVLQAAV